MMQPSIHFVIEGNIGAGKSTFLRMLGQYLHVNIIFEPHEQWQQGIAGENLLDKFYRDTPRWAYTFQSYAFITRIMAYEQAVKNRASYEIYVSERSVFSDRYCFARNCHELGTLSDLEWQLYQEWFSWLVNTCVQKPTGFIYMRTDPEVCYQRLRTRNRSEESAVSREYIQCLHDKHEAWLIHKQDIAESLSTVPVLVLSCDSDFEHNKKVFEEHIERIVFFIMQMYKDVGTIYQKSL